MFEETPREIRRMLSEGRLSQRRIAKLTGVSRTTVDAIATAATRDHEQQREARQDAEHQRKGPARRCGGCGGLVYMPCILCRVRQNRQTATKPRQDHPRLVHEQRRNKTSRKW